MCVGGLCAPFLCGDNSEAMKRVDFSVAVSVLSFVLDAGLYCSLIIGDVMAELCVRVVLKEIREVIREVYLFVVVLYFVS